MTKTVTIDGQEYTFGCIKTGLGRKMKDKYPDNSDFNVAFIAASLKAGGNADATPEWVDDNLDFYNGTFNEALKAALEINGFKVEQPKPGENQPEGLAESTSTTSTGA